MIYRDELCAMNSRQHLFKIDRSVTKHQFFQNIICFDNEKQASCQQLRLFLSTPVLMHSGLLYLALRLSVRLSVRD